MIRIISVFPGLKNDSDFFKESIQKFEELTNKESSSEFGAKFQIINMDIRLFIISPEEDIITNKDFPNNYINYIKNIISLDSSNLNTIIFVSSMKLIRNALIINKIKFSLVYPDISLKEKYIKKYEDDKYSIDFINTIKSNWESIINTIEKESKNCYSLIKLGDNTSLLNYLMNK